MSSNVQEGSDQDFRLLNGVLTINKRGYTLVFFKMANCEGCKTFVPQFHAISASTRKVDNFVMIDVSVYRKIVAWSRETKTPIQTVPLIILYLDGKPAFKYTGVRDVPSMMSFLDKNVVEHRNTQGFMQQPYQQPPQHPGSYVNGNNYPSQPQYEPPQRGTRPPQAYAQMNDVEDEDEDKLLLPGQVTPYNVPWEGSYRKMGPNLD